jgi:dynein heavy chain
MKLERANILTSSLASEQTRWTASVKTMKADKDLIPGNSIIAAGMISYSGPFTPEFRAQMEEDWRTFMTELKFPFKENVSMLSFMQEAIKL